ncbi:MAG: glycosyltransferase [Candidatus Falkowbacteria bacterium]|nr:glycosyltransferase [Candidatus Falkowbacteria bacterium]
MEKKKIKIVHVIPTLDLGGAERLLLDIVNRADKETFSLTVICFKRGGIWEEEIIKSGAKLIVLHKKGKFDFSNLVKLRQAILAEEPDIVHTHLGGDIYGRFLAGLAGLRVVSTEHNLNKDESFVTSILKRLTAPYVSLVIAVSRAVAHDAKLRYGIKLEKIKVIHNGIDLTRFKAVETFKTETVKIGAVGRLVEQKGFMTLVEALGLMKDKKFDCTIVGAGVLMTALKEKVNSLGLSSKVHLVGLRNDIPEFLQTLDIFVLPSLWEGLGIAALEAGASGLSVVASKVDGLPEIIDDQVNGLLFKVNDARDLKDKISYLLDNKDLARTFGHHLAKKVNEQFDVLDMVKQYEMVYKSLLSK